MISLADVEELMTDGLTYQETLNIIRRKNSMQYRSFDFGDRVKPEIVVTDGIMGSGKSEGLIHALREGMSNGQAFKECYLIIVPYLGEVQRYIDDLPELSFAQPEASNGNNKRDDFLRLVQDGRNIVTTHAMFQLWGSQVRDEISNSRYNIIIDEEVACIEPIEMTKKSYQELCSMDYISVEETGEVKWDFDKSGEPDTYDGRFKDIMNYCISGSVFLFEKTQKTKVFMVWNLPTDFFEVGKTIRVMTFRFKHSIIRAYFDIHKMPYRVEYVNKETQKLRHERATKFIDLVTIPNNIQQHIIGKTALSHSWNRNQTADVLKDIRTKMSNWIRNTIGATADNLIYTCAKSLADHTKTKHLVLPRFRNKEVTEENKKAGVTNLGPWLPFNTNGTNSFADKTVVLYMHNVYPNVTLTKFFTDNDVYFDEDEYAVSCMVQFIWRAAIRKREPEMIKLIIPSLRMKKLFEEWRDSELEFEAAAPSYKLLSPQGLLMEFNNLSDFCMINDIDKGNISKVLSGERNSHKGWRLNSK